MKKKLIEIFSGYSKIDPVWYDELADEILRLIVEDIDSTRDWDRFYMNIIGELDERETD